MYDRQRKYICVEYFLPHYDIHSVIIIGMSHLNDVTC